jgi:hypothetical protein
VVCADKFFTCSTEDKKTKKDNDNHKDNNPKTTQDKARQGKARQGKARQGKARQGKARQRQRPHGILDDFEENVV